MGAMLGRWDRWYGGVDQPQTYGDDTTYRLGAEWLVDCELIEDWGCGKGGLRLFIPAERYRGVDGSCTPFADVTADLTTYRSDVPGVFMRHVLEHNRQWRNVLDNALTSARQRFFVALFTPLADHTHQIGYTPDLDVPDLSFRLADLTEPIGAAGFMWSAETIRTGTQYGTETVLRCSR